MTRSRPCPECGLPADVIDPWVWERDGHPPVIFYDIECPARHKWHGLTDH